MTRRQTTPGASTGAPSERVPWYRSEPPTEGRPTTPCASTGEAVPAPPGPFTCSDCGWTDTNEHAFTAYDDGTRRCYVCQHEATCNEPQCGWCRPYVDTDADKLCDCRGGAAHICPPCRAEHYS